MIFVDGEEGRDKIDETLKNSVGSKFSEKTNNINNSGCGSESMKYGMVISRIMYDETSV